MSILKVTEEMAKEFSYSIINAANRWQLGTLLRQLTMGKRSIVEISGNYTVDLNDEVVVCTAPLTVSLYSAIDNKGMSFEILNRSAGNVTVTAFGTELIESGNTVIVASNTNIKLICNGTKWYKL